MNLDNSVINSGTEQGSDTEIAIQITGTATCYTLGLVPLYTTNYNEQIGGPWNSYKSAGSSKYISPNWNDELYYRTL
jgi:hypothetical protein